MDIAIGSGLVDVPSSSDDFAGPKKLALRTGRT